eukprot:7298111-Alexandrium_andersonii.AAC.1
MTSEPAGGRPSGVIRFLICGVLSGGHFCGLRRVPPSGPQESRKPAAIRSGRVEIRNCRA